MQSHERIGGRTLAAICAGVGAAALGCGAASSSGASAPSAASPPGEDSSGSAASSASSTSSSGGGLVGQKAPDFSAAAVANGHGQIALSDLRGKVVLVDFWGTFCEPCKKSFPKLQSLYGKYGASGLSIVAVSEDEAEDKAKIAAFGKAYGAKFTLAWDADKSIAQAYKPETMPSSFVLDKTGVVRFAHVGFHDGEEQEIEKEVQELLAR